MNHLSLFFDVILIAALAATIFHALRLSKQFNQMQADRKAFDTLIQSLNLAASRAEAAIRAMRETAGEAGDALQEKTGKARAMADELEIMVQAGDNLAERLNKLATESRKSAAPLAAAIDDAPQTQASAMQPRTKAEKELLEALKSKQKS